MDISHGNMLVFSDMKKTILFASYCLSKIVISRTLVSRSFLIRPSVQRGDEQTENLPILQDFVPYWGRCPASPHENQGESRAGQGNC